jgi:hypothetical protein
VNSPAQTFSVSNPDRLVISSVQVDNCECHSHVLVCMRSYLGQHKEISPTPRVVEKPLVCICLFSTKRCSHISARPIGHNTDGCVTFPSLDHEQCSKLSVDSTVRRQIWCVITTIKWLSLDSDEHDLFTGHPEQVLVSSKSLNYVPNKTVTIIAALSRIRCVIFPEFIFA